MSEEVDTSDIINLFRQHPEGSLYINYQTLSGLDEEQFLALVKALWDKGALTGITQDGCCGDGCAIFCVSYMKKERAWKLAG